ncbi:Hypothetical predicted protein [Lecanosticta acicola]|uniref:Uncharacterized protein n=1 Tax=Lecanosticta acicola TaxID=111012 RepID=A0AAI8Z2Z4_9PEZI|nr:Hypothetical predicted protein [Lecanosticta acicola]
METSPPLTPLRSHMSPLDTSSSPSHSFSEQLRRRTSSFSSNHDRSPLTPANRHRFSNASQLSGDFGTPVDEGGGGLGNLADELDQLDDDDDFEEGETEDGLRAHGDGEKDEASRDSGIDVSYRDSKTKSSPNSVRNFSKPFAGKEEEPPDEEEEYPAEERFSRDLENLMSTVARMTSYTSTTEDPLIPRTIGAMQDLGNQSSLEAAAQRFTTSTNSLTAYLTSQTKSLQTLAQSLYPLYTFSAPLDPTVVEEALPLAELLLSEIPQPDVEATKMMHKLGEETQETIEKLSQLTDTLQMGKQITATAARHLRNTQDMVVDLREEQERAELARHELAKSDWEEKVKDRWCAAQCQDIMSGFEDRCTALRGSLEEAINAGA